jgi:uncharacterized membrane-anchored protein YjiN (DUF445 family)
MTSESDQVATATARAAFKRPQLRQMQRLATALLCAALALLLFSAKYQAIWPWLQWLRAFAEAAAIGAIADWYAVVALFRRPLGLPIPHTAIIPENKNSIGRSLGEFVAQYLLTPENIVGKLGQYDTARQLAGWLAVPANAHSIAATLTSFVPGFLRAPDDADLRRFLQQNLAPKLLELDAGKIAGKVLERLMAAGLHRPALDRGLVMFDRWLAANEALIRTQFAAASKYTPAVLDSYIVRKFLEGIRNLVHDAVGDPQHALRQQFDDAMRTLIRDLQQSPQQRESARAWLRSWLEHCAVDEDWRSLRDTLATQVESDLSKQDSALRQFAVALILAVAQGILRDPVVLERLNGVWLRFARSVSLQHRGQIASLIAEVVRGWDAHEVGRKIELEIGRDLQFIRINGALVGGLVGVVLHACTLPLR